MSTIWLGTENHPASLHRIDEEGGSRSENRRNRTTATGVQNFKRRYHNSHPQSAKRDWKIGDVRAVMQVTKVIEPFLVAAEQRSQTIVWVLAAIAALASTPCLAI